MSANKWFCSCLIYAAPWLVPFPEFLIEVVPQTLVCSCAFKLEFSNNNMDAS